MLDGRYICANDLCCIITALLMGLSPFRTLGFCLSSAFLKPNDLLFHNVPGHPLWLRHCATSRKVPGSIPGVAGFFSVASDSSMCPGVDSASKNEYQVNPGRKGGRCVRLTTYHVHVPMSRNLRGGGLTSWNPVGLFRPVMGQLYFYLAILQQLHTCYACRPSACFTLYWRNFVCDVHTEATHKKYKNYVLLSRVLSSNF